VIYARNIAAALAKVDPANAAAYAASAAAYIASLEALDTRIKAALDAIPAERRKVVTSHDAFGYFGAAYGVEFIAPTGVSTEAEASAAYVARIIDQIKVEHITAVFVENITNTRLIDQIAQETGAVVGGQLYCDALSGPDGPASAYLKMFEWNAEQLTKALGTS
jgi:zinc/manganese transport system substrate-binding protein